jgi:hypothetical protein
MQARSSVTIPERIQVNGVYIILFVVLSLRLTVLPLEPPLRATGNR